MVRFFAQLQNIHRNNFRSEERSLFSRLKFIQRKFENNLINESWIMNLKKKEGTDEDSEWGMGGWCSKLRLGFSVCWEVLASRHSKVTLLILGYGLDKMFKSTSLMYKPHPQFRWNFIPSHNLKVNWILLAVGFYPSSLDLNVESKASVHALSSNWVFRSSIRPQIGRNGRY